MSFPIGFRKANVSGVEVKLEAPARGKFSGFLSYSNTNGLGQFSISDGLFLDDDVVDLLNAM